MNLFDQRVLFSDNGVITDISASVNNYKTGTTTIEMVAGQDYIYIGTAYPWSARYFEVGTPNNADASVVVELWDSGTWRSAVDIIDLTRSASGHPLSVSGYIRFLRDRNLAWARPEKSNEIAELSSTLIYDMYWMRLSYSATLHNNTSLKFIGSKFSEDADLYPLFPDLNQAALKTLFQAGKTDWNDQHFMAAQAIVDDLKARNLVLSQDQVLDPWAFKTLASYKVAAIIYGGLGDAYAERLKHAHSMYQETFNTTFKSLNLDHSVDGTLSRGEQMVSYGRLVR